ncbi:hypothetical protein MKW98_006285 [Papaver atlanticum]|uniref:Uncharacterized protein n=1 Tax=Papaver atlanticum TaxID=357466 RepID=A0AAD4XW88_9MAGN|nr:hypothetical protein MKW98_006285 [Papaver atlanticum]
MAEELNSTLDHGEAQPAVSCTGSLDVLLTFGAYTTARGMTPSSLFIRFFCGISSVAITYIYDGSSGEE